MQETMSIAQRLPYDILYFIFTYCWRIKKSEKWALIDRTDFPILLLHVCSSWRKAALSTPVLWSNLALTFGKATGMSVEKVENRARILDDWVDLVGHGPKSLSLAFDDNRSFYDFELPEASCAGIRHLWLFRSPHIVDLLPEGFSLPRLETLVLFARHETALDGRPYMLPSLLASQLRKLWLHDVDPIAFLDKRHSWIHLTHLILEDSVPSLSSIFHSCPQLEEAVIFLEPECLPDSSIAVVDDLEPPFSHRSLTELVLYTFFRTETRLPSIASCFREWHLPALASFQISPTMHTFEVFRNWAALMKRMPNLREAYLGPDLSFSALANEAEIYDAFNTFNPLLDTLILDQSDKPTHPNDPYHAHPFSTVDLLRRFLLSRITSSGALVPIKKLVILITDLDDIFEISKTLLLDIEDSLGPLLAGGKRGSGRLELELELTSIPYRSCLTFHGRCAMSHQVGSYVEEVMKDYSTYRAFAVE